MKRATLAPLLLFCAALLLFSLTLSRNLGASHDSITYINAIERAAGAELFHPHHLLYHGLARAWLLAARAVGVESDGALVVAWLNSLFGALSLVLFFQLLRVRLRLSPWASGAMAALAGVSYGFWFYSCCVEVYIVPLFFLLLALFLASGRELGTRAAGLIGLMHGLAMLFHQAHVLFAPVVLAALLARRRDGTRIWRSLSLYAAVGSATVVLPYAIVLLTVVEVDGPGAAFKWFTFLAHIPEVSFWNPLAVATALKSALGLSRAFVGGQFLLALPQVQDRSDLLGKSLTDEAFLVREMSHVGAYALVGAVALAIVVALLALIVALKRRGRLLPQRPRVVTLALVWLLVYGAFFFFWDSSNVEFWIPQGLCVWLLFGWLVFGERGDEPGAAAGAPSDGQRGRVALTASLALLLFYINLGGSIRFLHRRENDFYWQSIRPIVARVEPSDLILCGRAWIWGDYYARYSPAPSVCLGLLNDHFPDAKIVAMVRRRVEATRRAGGRVFVTQDAARFSHLEDDEHATRLTEAVWHDLRAQWKSEKIVGAAPTSQINVLPALR